MSSTQTKKWSPPKGWQADDDAQTFGEDKVVMGRRTYPDGTSKEIQAHSEDEFERLAKTTDMQTALDHRNKRQELLEEADRLKARVKEIEAEAKRYDWAI